MSGDQFGWGVDMGRPCKCCNSTEACKNENSNFSTPWIINHQPFLDRFSNFLDVSTSINSISGYVSPLQGTCITSQVDCSYYSQWLPTAPIQRPCFNCGDDLYGSIFSDPWGNEIWCGYYPDVGFPLECMDNIYPRLAHTITKIAKIRKGNYTVNLSGYDTYSVSIGFSKKCFSNTYSQCENIEKSFFTPNGYSDEYIEGTINSGPVNTYLYYDCNTQAPLYDNIVYPFNISFGPIIPYGYPVDFSNFSFSVEEDCFLYLSIFLIKFSKVEIVSETCQCPEISLPPICFRPPRPISVLKYVKNTNPEPFYFSISIDGDVIETDNSIKYVVGNDCYD